MIEFVAAILLLLTFGGTFLQDLIAQIFAAFATPVVAMVAAFPVDALYTGLRFAA